MKWGSGDMVGHVKLEICVYVQWIRIPPLAGTGPGLHMQKNPLPNGSRMRILFSFWRRIALCAGLWVLPIAACEAGTLTIDLFTELEREETTPVVGSAPFQLDWTIGSLGDRDSSSARGHLSLAPLTELVDSDCDVEPSGDGFDWPLGDVLAGERFVCRLTLRSTADNDARPVFEVVVSSFDNDPVPENNTDAVEVPVRAPRADLATALASETVQPLARGESYDVEWTVRNLGPEDAVDAVGRLADATGSTAQTSSCTLAPDPASGELVWRFASLPAGASRTCSISFIVDADADAGLRLQHAARVTATTRDDDATNNDAALEMTVAAPAADLAVALASDAVQPLPRESNFDIEWTARNLGPDDATDAVARLSPAAGASLSGSSCPLTIDSATGDLLWRFATLASGATRVCTVGFALVPDAASRLDYATDILSPLADRNLANNRAALGLAVVAPVGEPPTATPPRPVPAAGVPALLLLGGALALASLRASRLRSERQSRC